MAADQDHSEFNLGDIEAFVFDVFGTTVDWFTTVSREVAIRSRGHIAVGSQDAIDFANEWRDGYKRTVSQVSQGGQGSLSIDIVHKDLLEYMLESPRWSRLAAVWSQQDRNDLVMTWHNLDPYPGDTLEGLAELKKHTIIATLSNGNLRLLLDMAKNASLPWDAILSAELFGTYKPAPKAYLSAAYHLSVEPQKIAMVAAHKYDLLGAAKVGFKTIYVPRPAEDTPEIRAEVKAKKHGGEVDLVVRGFVELASLVANAHGE
ncbi:HAD-like domain-containing protein [Hygrophoropsis aurantiaca]|uniref:HAD-like domain-containing protein n=1 Tax=Hygrophoropsis aurantiaca TaxID=72124 RepID=A0ACB8A6B5_9AGAM|nr:HAD-like domain-containing protein [Hygrophoropsis aurantiaca]